MIETPGVIVNQALDAIGKPDLQLGEITDGTLAGRAARRIYGPTLRQLLRTAHWAFARRHGEMQLLGDATGQYVRPSGGPALGTAVEQPWRFCYAWPTDAVQPRWLPYNGSPFGNGAPTGNIAIGNAPLMPGLNQIGAGPWLRNRPARFLSSTTRDYPVVAGQMDWSEIPDLDDIEGVGLTSRRCILTDVPPWQDEQSQWHGAALVYTVLSLEIEMWDSLFRQAMVAVLAERLAMPLIAKEGDRASQQLATAQRNAQIAIAKDAIMQARVASANEAGFPQSTDQIPDWILARRARAGFSVGDSFAGGFGGAAGYLLCPWSGFAFSDGGVF